jgi:hypothetical protein
MRLSQLLLFSSKYFLGSSLILNYMPKKATNSNSNETVDATEEENPFAEYNNKTI